MKFQIRSLIRQRRILLSEEERRSLSLRLIDNLKSLISLFPTAESFLFFYPIKGEPDLLPLASELLDSGKRVLFPKVDGGEILPVEVSSLKELLPGKFGIPEPPLDYGRVLRSPDVVFVPGLAFDIYGFRIGYGGGFYDRFLARVSPLAKIGVCFGFQLFSELPHDPFDIPVDYITTEKNWRRRREWKRF